MLLARFESRRDEKGIGVIVFATGSKSNSCAGREKVPPKVNAVPAAPEKTGIVRVTCVGESIERIFVFARTPMPATAQPLACSLEACSWAVEGIPVTTGELVTVVPVVLTPFPNRQP